MLHSLTSSSAAGGAPGASEVIRSRFGNVEIDRARALSFPRGLLGMPDKQKFAVVNFPTEKMKQFTLLQSLDDAALSFITLPVSLENAFIQAGDIRAACRDLQIAESSLVLLLIVSVHRSPDQVRLSANARAPIFIDVARKTGMQHVFQQDHYKVQHML